MSGYLLVTLTLVGVVALNRLRGYSLTRSIPEGYRLTGVGLLIFAAGGVGDMVCGRSFLASKRALKPWSAPSHLLLGLGSGLVVTRAFAGRVAPARRYRQLAHSHTSNRFVGPVPRGGFPFHSVLLSCDGATRHGTRQSFS